MDVIEYVGKVLGLSHDEVIEHSRSLGDGLTYYWSLGRGGSGLIIDEKGNYLWGGSSVGFEKLLEEYRKGEKVKNRFTEFYAMVNERTASLVGRGDDVLYGVRNGKIFKSGRSEGIVDEGKVEAIKRIINDNLEKVKIVCNKPMQNYKGGRQEILTIKINGDIYSLFGNTPDSEMKVLYQQLKDEISKIIFEKH